MTTLTFLLLLATPSLAQGDPPLVPSAQKEVQSTRWELLAAAGRYDELATLSRDVVLTRRLSELKRARFMQQRLHAQYQPRHPRRDAIDDRVLLLEGAVVNAATHLIERYAVSATVVPTELASAAPADQSGKSQGEPLGSGAGAGAR